MRSPWTPDYLSVNGGGGSENAQAEMGQTSAQSPAVQNLVAAILSSGAPSSFRLTGDKDFNSAGATADLVGAQCLLGVSRQDAASRSDNNLDSPIFGRYDLSNPDNFPAYLESVHKRHSSGGELDEQDIATSRALLHNYYGYPMGEQRGTAEQLRGNADAGGFDAHARALNAFGNASPEERQNRYSFYSGIRLADGGNPRGRYVDVNRDGRTVRVNWDPGFSDLAGQLGVSADEALRKTDFDVYQAALNAALDTDGVNSININGAWRPSYSDYRSIAGHSPPVRYDDNSMHISSRALDINKINNVAINNGGYHNNLPANPEPDIVTRFSNNIVATPGVRQTFQPWRMWKNTLQDNTTNNAANSNAYLHRNHLHFGF